MWKALILLRQPNPAAASRKLLLRCGGGAPAAARSLSSSTSMMLRDDDDDDGDNSAERQQRRDADVREALDGKTGRLWSDPWDLEDMMESKLNFDDLPDWGPQHVSRISQERVRVLPSGIPTLAEMAALALPPPPPPHPGMGFGKAYALERKRAQYRYVLDQVERAMVDPARGPGGEYSSGGSSSRIDRIRSLKDWQEKQDAVDELFEGVEFELRTRETVLGRHPSFGNWVERALEEYLRGVQKVDDEGEKGDDKQQLPTVAGDGVVGNDDAVVPVFMDCYDPSEDTPDEPVPLILRPLKSETSEIKETVGKMVEEWELSAHPTSRRIMLRRCTAAIAGILSAAETDDAPSSKGAAVSRIFVSGRQQGVGKTAALAAIVASARKSGSGIVVLYLPYGDQLHKNGFYIEPNAHRPGVFDLPILSQQVCQQLLDSHETDLARFEADDATLRKYFTEDQMVLLAESAGGGSGAAIKIVDLLKLGTTKTSFAAMCYSAVIDVLMGQDEVPFLMVLDEFNCYFEPGHYFHMAYDVDVKKPIPYDQISLFQPALDAMAISAEGGDDDDDEAASNKKKPACMKRGAIIVATTESHAVARTVTDGLIANAKMQAAASSRTDDDDDDAAAVVPIHVVDVPRLSALEVEHMLANYEATGVGKLRMDRGETVMNEQEVAYLRMVSGGVAQRLMDACIID